MDAKAAGDTISQWSLNNGLAVVLLVGGLIFTVYYGKKLSVWLGINFLIPMKDAAISHLKTTDKAMEETSTTMQSMQGTLGSIHEELKANRASNQAVHDAIKQFTSEARCKNP